MKRKVRPLVGFKSLISEGPGIFEAIVSVFGNVDYAGDRVLPGAFAKSLERWRESGDPIPVIFAHQWDNLDAHVGEVLEAKELLPGAPELEGTSIADLGGLWVKGRLDVDEDFAGRLWKRLETRRIKEFSFAYDVIDERRSSDGANDLVELDVFEVGPCLKGMNPATELLLAKSLAARILEAKTDDPAELEKMIAAELEKSSSSMPPHAFIPSDDDPTRCSVEGCGMTRNTSAHLHTLSTDPDGSKAFVTLAGSVEERQEAIYRSALEELPLEQANGGFYALYLEATFDDRAVFMLEGWNDPPGEGIYFEADVVDGDDGPAVANVREVEIEATTRPKARAKELRSTKTRGTVGSVKSDGDRSGKSEGKGQGSAEDPEDRKTRTGSESGTRGEASRLLLELDELELT